MLGEIVRIDYDVSRFLLNFMDSHPLLRAVIDKISTAEEAKGLIPALIFWYLWFSGGEQRSTIRTKLCAIGITTVVSIVVGRMLANFLPFRQRPWVNEQIVGSDIGGNQFFEEWSSMPSDHAVMFFTLAAGFFLISKRVGLLAFLHAAIIVCVPRVILGLHYVSDIVAGAVVGIMLALILVPYLSKVLDSRIDIAKYPKKIVYPVLFFATFNIATMFNGVRGVGSLAKMLLQ